MGNHDSVAKGGTEAQVLELGDECGGMVMFYTVVDEQQPDVCVVVFQLVQNVMESTFC